MKWIDITDGIADIKNRTISFQWDGTQENYFEIWDKLPNTEEVSIMTNVLNIKTFDGDICVAQRGDWVTLNYPGIYKCMKNEEFVQKYKRFLK